MNQKAEDVSEGPVALYVNRHKLGATGSFPEVIYVGSNPNPKMLETMDILVVWSTSSRLLPRVFVLDVYKFTVPKKHTVQRNT